MSRFAAIFCAVGLWALPAAAQSPRSDEPTVAARTQNCTTQQRARCGAAVGQSALETESSCDACLPMPAEVIAPASPTPAERTTTPECLPRASGPPPDSCVDAPRLDHIPRP